MFVLQFAKFNLKAPPYSKTMHCKCSPWKMQNYDFYFLLLRFLLLKVKFNLVSADIQKNHGVHPVPLGKWSNPPVFFHMTQFEIERWSCGQSITNFRFFSWGGGQILIHFVIFFCVPFKKLTKKWKKCSKSIQLWFCI